MNSVLELKGNRFVQAPKSDNGGGSAMNSKVVVTSQKLNKLISKLFQIKDFWIHENRPFNGILISVHYNKIVAKSNRIAGLFKRDQSSYAIVGAKFNAEKTKHIITYFLSIDDLDNSIDMLYKSDEVISSVFKDGITKAIFEYIVTNKINFQKYGLTKSLFKQIVADSTKLALIFYQAGFSIIVRFS